MTVRLGNSIPVFFCTIIQLFLVDNNGHSLSQAKQQTLECSSSTFQKLERIPQDIAVWARFALKVR